MDKTAFLISLQEVRRILEPGAAVLAARRRTPEQLEALEDALEGMRNAASAETMVEPDVRFHLTILASTNNELLSPFGIVIEQALAHLFQYTSRHNAKPEQVVPMHEDVLKAIAGQKPEAARRAMTVLLDDTDGVIGKAPEDDTATTP